MANRHQLAKLQEGVGAWNEWIKQHPDIGINLTKAKLQNAKLSNADLSGVDFFEANLDNADLSGANLSGAMLGSARMYSANLSGANLSSADLSHSNLRWANLSGANLSEATLDYALLVDTNMCGANLRSTQLGGAKLVAARMVEADLSEADISGADLVGAKLEHAKFCEADLSDAKLNSADLSGADLAGADLRSSSLQGAKLDGAKVTDIKLWETQRAGWSIKGIICERVYWDKSAEYATLYAPGEFERLHSEQTCIELFYQSGVSTFEISTLPVLLHHLATLHPNTSIRLKSIDETGGGARISISVADSDPETVENVRADAMKVYHAQLALREKETERLRIEKTYIENFFIGKLIPAMLHAGAPQNVFNAPVTGMMISGGESKLDFHQSIGDNSAILALLEKIVDNRADLQLPADEETKLQAVILSATSELHRQDPDQSLLSKSVHFIQQIAKEAVKKAAGKLGEEAVSTDWQNWLHQLNQHVVHWR
ncbi:pentapeptide repeat-containing protein [Acidipila rosea]|uniref:Uncharacterized protein YjbI with pentapeptide repeats n=1 Tax=Acidipila rosea TaxID=768535 RepID=A0A4R1L6W1_9BACT|nr:pentapeptide repeat-containing protein [Acidipila rosea]TCK72029.1 uncharacterized protein YjbI with pentapeptide repeats [Acidipila rosea]